MKNEVRDADESMDLLWLGAIEIGGSLVRRNVG